MFADVDVAADAFAVIGEHAPQSFSDDVPGGADAGRIYRNVVGFAVGVYPFSFAREWFALGRLATSPSIGFAHAYLCPPERLGPPVRVAETPDDDAPAPRHLLKGNELWSDAEQIWVECKVLPPPERWSATFRKTVVTALAAEYALATASDRNTWAALRAAAYGTEADKFRGGYMGAAIAEDARATPPRRLPSSSPLIAARFR